MVMASGVVSLDLVSGGWKAASLVPLAAGALAWLVALARGDLARGPDGVAATAVLATRLAVLGWTAPAGLLAAGAAALWVLVIPRWAPERPASGSCFLPAVATQSLAVVATELGLPQAVSGAAVAVGLALYVRAAVGFDPSELLRGRGDHWIAGGALAISALACARVWHDASVVLWVGAMAWLPALVVGEVLRPRFVGAPERWSTVFPLGMYAAMSFAVEPGFFARGWTWVAAAAWLIVLTSALRPRRA
jgi:hypothetical protein